MLLAGGVAAAVSAATIRFAADERPRIAGVRIGELAAEYAAQAVRADGAPEETAIAARAWALALEDALRQVAMRNRAVLFSAHAIAAGAPDVTAQVEAALAAAVRPPVMNATEEPLP